MKTKINAEVVADSLSIKGDRITSLLITFPRFILAEVNTHRMLTKNTSSSRAIPFKKMIKAIDEDPFIPIAWQKEHKGMQGTEYITNEDHINYLRGKWCLAKREAIKMAQKLHDGVEIAEPEKDENDNNMRGLIMKQVPNTEVTKQLCNRLLEPFMWTTMLITGSREGWENFFKLRCPSYEEEGNRYYSWKDLINHMKINYPDDMNRIAEFEHYYNTTNKLMMNKGQAEIHMMQLAECIYDAMSESKPEQLKEYEWHIPFKKYINENYKPYKYVHENIPCPAGFTNIETTKLKVKISVAMAAHTSYTVVGNGIEKNIGDWLKIYDKLVKQNPPHSSPLEHCARAMSNEDYMAFIKGDISGNNLKNASGWCGPYRGFISHRYLLENGTK